MRKYWFACLLALLASGCSDDKYKSCADGTQPFCSKENAVTICLMNKQVELECDEGDTCRNGECRDLRCLLSMQPYCDGTTAITCVDNVLQEQVCGNEQTCRNGRCEEGVCRNDMTPYCEGNTLVSCENGEFNIEICENGMACVDGACPEKETCSGNEAPFCVENSRKWCENGEYFVADCGSKMCVEGECKRREAVEFEPVKTDEVCQGDEAASCSENSRKWCDNGSFMVQNCGEFKCHDGACLDDGFAAVSGNDLFNHLGSTVVDGGVRFAVYAKNATRVELLIFDSAKPDDDPVSRIPMEKDDVSGIWKASVAGAGEGTLYGYIAFGPNWPYSPAFTPGSVIGSISECDSNGNRYNPNKLLLDPYARRIDREFAIKGGSNPETGNSRSICNWKTAPKSVVVQSDYKWSANEEVWREKRISGDAASGHDYNDLIIYEVQPKGFTKKAVSLDFGKLTDGDKLKIDFKTENQGTWRGIGEMAPYLADLGITAVELLPVGETVNESTYWGYNTIQYFTPEMEFASVESRAMPSGVLDEFKEMVDALHQNGIEVILDVVYNHSGEGQLWQLFPNQTAGDGGAFVHYSFRGLDNSAYYHLINENQAYYDGTGVGNQLRTNATPMRRLILDNLRFWVDEMHVDGFRFDLALIVGEMDENARDITSYVKYNEYWAQNVGHSVLQDIIDDDLMAKYHTRFIAEPWGLQGYTLGLFPKSDKHKGQAWSEWNGRFRDLIKPFVNYDQYSLNDAQPMPPRFVDTINVENALTGSSYLFGQYFQEIYPGSANRYPYNSINYITSHDGFTLYDLVSYSEKQNGCTAINPQCCSSGGDACDINGGSNAEISRDWCGGNKDSNGRCRDEGAENYKRQIIRDFFAILFLSQGTPMILGGDEFMRTQFGNNNAHAERHDNEWNWFRWNDWMSNDAAMRMHDFVRDMIKIRKQYKTFLSPKAYGTNGMQTWNPIGLSDVETRKGRAIAFYYPENGSTPALYVIYNMDTVNRSFMLPGDSEWKILVDTQSYFETNGSKTNTWFKGERVIKNSYEAVARSVVVLTK